MELGRRALSGALVTLGGQWTRYVIQFGSIVVLSRLLTPEDFGVIGMVAVVISLGETIRDAGLTNGAIRRKELTNAEQTTLFAVNVALGVVIAGLVAAAAYPLADFYDEPQVASVALALAAVPLIGALGAQHLVDLSRTFRFHAIAAADVAGVSLGTAVGILLAAVFDAGVWSLVGFQLVQVTVRSGWLIRSSNFQLTSPAPLRELVPILRFGRNLALVQLLDFASRNVDNLIIGRVAGAATLGVYTRAYQLLLLPIQQINAPLTRVALPVLAQVQDDPPRFARYAISGSCVLSYFGAAVVGTCVVFTPELVTVTLGPQWTESVTLFRILAVAGVFQAIGYIAYWLFMALDRTGTHLRYALVAKPLIIVGFLVGAGWGATGVAAAYSVVTALTVPVSIVLATRNSPVRTLAILGPMFRAILAATSLALVGLCLKGEIDPTPLFWASLATTVTAVLAMLRRYSGDVVAVSTIAVQLRSRRTAAHAIA